MNNIKECKVPTDLREKIIKSWSWASDLIDYRDCLLHYTILSKSVLPSVMVIHSENEIIALIVELPDNPEARKLKDFKFETHIDYLGYANSTYLKLFDLCYYVLENTHSEVKDSITDRQTDRE